MGKDLAWFNWVILIVGILMLGQDLGWWAFWGIGAWTSVFLLYAISKLAK